MQQIKNKQLINHMHISSKAAILPSSRPTRSGVSPTPTATMTATFSPLTPFSPFSPTSPNTPMTTAPQFGLRQSTTNLSHDLDVEQLSNEITSDASSYCTDEDDADDICTFSTKDLLMRLSEQDLLGSHEDPILAKNGYKQIIKIQDTTQGEIHECEIIDPYKRAKAGMSRVAIKQTSKALHRSGESIQKDGFRTIVEENIIKEAMLLKYLTKDNRPNGGYIAKYVDFFESDTHYYLVMEYVGDKNLAEFVKEAHQYIKEKKLKLSAYKQVIKFLFWQICVMVHWMHNDMKTCHNDLCLENIIVRDGNFEEMEDGSVKIDSNIAIKIADFGLAEAFGPEVTNVYKFKMGKWGLKDSFETTAPNVYNELMFNGMKADIWSLGCILFKLLCGKSLYRIPDHQVDPGYYCILHQKLEMHLQIHQLNKFFHKKVISLIKSMLTVNESKRFSALQVLKCQWFDAYFKRYSQRIEKKSASQKVQLQKQQEKMRNFPFYRQ